MLRLIYLYRNLTRNRLRTTLTCLAVALPITIYVLSMAVVDGIEGFLDNAAKQLRLAVTQKTSIASDLPEGYRTKIESLDPSHERLIAVCGMRWLGGKIENDPRPLSTLGVDVDTFLTTFPEYALTKEEHALWIRDRQAIIIGSSTAGQFGWEKGDRITIRPSVAPYTPMEFHVISTAEGAPDPLTNWCRRDYVEEEIKRQGYREGYVHFLFAKCATSEDLDHFRVAIDGLFARSPDETKTQDEKAFMSEFITQQFDLPRNLTILAAVTVFVAVMAAANTMSMNFRDRLSEVAILKSLGFGDMLILSQIQFESMLLCLVGGAAGAIAPYVAFTHTAIGDITVPIIQRLHIDPAVCLKALLISALIGVLAALWPSWLAVRTRVIAALRNLE